MNYTGDKFTPWKNYWIGLSGEHLSLYLKETELSESNIINLKNSKMCRSY